MKPEIDLELHSFLHLTPTALYELLKLRSMVFVVEQQCIFLDMDGLDAQAHHVLGWQGNTLLACARILPPGVAYPEYHSIGRVVTHPHGRGSGYGKALMEYALQQLYILYGSVPVKIGAQLYLKRFYESFGFVQAGDMYLEDGIEHIPMIKHTVQ